MKAHISGFLVFVISLCLGIGGFLLTPISSEVTVQVETTETTSCFIDEPNRVSVSIPTASSEVDLTLPPSPDGAYFPVEDTKFEEDTALVMSFLNDFNVGSIKIKDDFLDSDLVVTEDKVRLQTHEIRGVRYIFNGRFLKDGFKLNFEDGETVLTGTLTKYRRGKKIYSASSKFLFLAEVCAWNENNRSAN